MNNKKALKILSQLIALAIMLGACKKQEDMHDHSQHQMPNTRIVEADGLKVVFDVQDKQAFERMATMMALDTTDKPQANRYVLLTVMQKGDAGAQTLIKDAQVSLQLENDGQAAINLTTFVLEGKGMHHFAAALDQASGRSFKLIASITHGESVVEAKAEFKN